MHLPPTHFVGPLDSSHPKRAHVPDVSLVLLSHDVHFSGIDQKICYVLSVNTNAFIVNNSYVVFNNQLSYRVPSEKGHVW